MSLKFTHTIGLLLASAATAQNPPIDLNAWTTEQINGTAPWVVDAGKRNCYATNTINTDASVLYSNFPMPTSLEFRMWIDPAGGDDDLSGFILGWNPGDSSNASADYLVIDWKKATQNYQDWGTANVGLAVSRMTGQFTRGYGGGPKDLWSHTANCTELARGNNYGSIGWGFSTYYNFKVLFTPATLDIWLNGNLEFHLTGSFNFTGRFACYQYSQDHTSFQFPISGSWSTFGNGCRGSAGTPYLFSPEVPLVGEKLPVVIANLPPAATVMLALGGSSSLWGAIPLPFDLGVLGAPGCNLLVSPDILLPVTNYGGTAFLSFLPAGAAAGPVPFFLQGIVIDPSANGLGIVFSNAGKGTFGVR